jgi:hypothetical protein
MGSVDIAPNSDIGGYPLVSAIVGAATRWQAESDASDATYVKEETGVPGIDILGMPNPTIPGGAVVTGAELHIRVAHATAMTTASYGLYAPPKSAYRSPWSPDLFANVQTPLGTNAGAWYYTSPADSVIRDVVVSFNNTWQYNNGFGYDYLDWNKIDFSNMRILYSWTEYTGGTGLNRLYKMFVRVFYDQPPTVSGIQPTDLSAGQTFTTTPTIKWTYADTENTIQSQYRVVVVKSDVLDAYGRSPGSSGYDPSLATSTAYDSGVVPGPASQSTVSPKGLTNLSNYYAYVKVWHSPVNSVEMASSWTASAVFQVNGTAPSAPTMTAVGNNTNARIDIEVVQGSWSSTPYPSYFNVYKLIDSVNGVTEFVRGGINDATMTGMRTGSTSGNHITTPHHASLAITGNIDIRLLVSFEATPSGEYLIVKNDTSGSVSWNLRMMSSNKPQFEFWNGSLQTALCNTALTMPAVKTPFWLRCKHTTASNWHTDFWYSFESPDTVPSKVNWQTLGSFTGTGSGTMTSTTSVLGINGSNNTAQGLFRVYYAEVQNSSAAIVANPDFRGSLIGSTTLTDSTGKVWTIARTGANQNLAFTQYYDYEEPPATSRFYTSEAVTLAAGSPVSSTQGVGFSSGWTIAAPYTWWFKTVLIPTLNKTFQLLPGSWDANIPAETAAFSPLGRPRKVVVSDGTKGVEQTLQVECITQTDYDNLKAIYDAQQVVLVQTSATHQRYLFFNSWKDERGTIASGYFIVALGAIEVDRPTIV